MIKLRVATWNIGGGFISENNTSGFNKENLHYFADELKRSKSDIICLQEIHVSKDKNIYSQAKLLAHQLDIEDSCFCIIDSVRSSHLKKDLYLGLAILSKFPIINHEYHRISNPNMYLKNKKGTIWRTHDKGFLFACIKIRKYLVNILNAHLYPFHVFNRDFMENEFYGIRFETEQLLIKLSNNKTIIAGDMNYDQVEKVMPKLFQHGFTKTISGVSTVPELEIQLDHIIVSKGWGVESNTVIKGRADHYLCCADLSYP